MIKTFINDLQLPVNPLEDITFSTDINTKNIDLISFGEIVTLGNKKPIEFSINSIFTDKKYPFVVVTNPLLAIDYVNKLYNIINNKSPVRFILTGDQTDVNMLCVITSFKHTQKFGEEGEYYYTLKMFEYREPKVKKVIVQFPESTQNIPLASKSQTVRKEPAVKQTTYKVKAGDCLWNIAKAFYGDGSKYTLIQNANPKTKTKGIHPGDVLIIPGVSSSKGITPATTGGSTSSSAKTSGVPSVGSVVSGLIFSAGVSTNSHGGGGRSMDYLPSSSGRGSGGGRSF